jgi:hypothetical protein
VEAILDTYLLCLRDWGILSEMENDNSDLDDGDEYLEEDQITVVD